MEPTTTVWRPTHKQELVLSLPDTVFEALFGGAAYGGKSELLLYLPIARRFVEHPQFKGLILRRTFPELEREMIRRAYEIYPLSGAIPKDEGRTWKFPSGAFIDFGHAENEKDVYKYDTSQYNYLAFDELTTFTEFQYRYLTHRCRSRSSDLPAIVRSAATPGNVGHGWTRKRFVEPCKEGMKILVDKVGNKRIFIPAKLIDNPYGLKNDPDYARRLEMLPESERRAKKEGDWWTFSGQVFDDWRIEPFPGEPPNARHVVNPNEIEVPPYCPHIVSIDWGYAAMLWAGFGVLLPSRRIYIYREYTTIRTKISTWATDIGRLCDPIKDNLVKVVLCKSAWQQRGDESTLAQQFQEFSGIIPYQPDPDRVTGRLLVQEYLRWMPKPPRRTPQDGFDPNVADKILRIKGLNAYREYCGLFEEELPETNLPKLLISKSCVELIHAIPLCVFDDNHPEDVKEFDGDDPYDGLRYLLQAVQEYLDSPERRKGDFESRSQVLKEITENKIDMNSFYRKMEYLESKNKKAVRVLTHHGG